MDWIMLLRVGFCIVVAGLLSAGPAPRETTAASIRGVASAVSEAFPAWGLKGLDNKHLAQGDWGAMAIEAGKKSSAIFDRFHAELRYEDNVLDQVSKVSKAVADKGRGKARGFNIPFVASDSNELQERRGTCQRMLNYLSKLDQTGYTSREDFHESFNNFQVDQRNQLNARINLSLPNDEAKGGAPVQATDADGLFQLAINRVNKAISKAHGRVDPAHASFIRALYGEHAAVSMYDSAVSTANKRFGKLSKTIKVERAWFEKDVNEWLESRSLPESECPTTAGDLQTVLEETAAVADKWRGKLQELYSN